VLHRVLAEVAAAGVSEAAVVVSPNHEAMLRAYLQAVSGGPFAKDLPERTVMIVQDRPLGFGHAVWLAKKFAGRSPFLVMLGDHVHVARAGRPPCAAQVARAFARWGGAAMTGVQPVGAGELPRVGVAGGAPLGGGVYRCTAFIEKPGRATARRRLRTPGLPRGLFLAHCGIYAFSPAIFDCLAELMGARGAGRRGSPARAPGGEVQLADAQGLLLAWRPADYRLIRIEGRAYDTGTPAGYIATLKGLLSGT
jgi:UTP--glucose-1-phosphate uridylyltransferase